MHSLPYALGGLALLVAVLLRIVQTRPATFRVTRERTMPTTPEAIFPLLNDFHAWGSWSPWEKLDPAMRKTYAGPDAGEGAHQAWEGPKSGSGAMTITESVEGARVAIDLEFRKPMPAHNKTVFTLQPEGSGTRVVWTMEGNNTFLGKLFGLVMNMDKLIGKDFESGLAAMESVAVARSR